MLIKTQVLRVNSEYGIMPFQMFFYITDNKNPTLMSTMVKVNCFRIHFKHSEPRYVIKIYLLNKNLPDYAKLQIRSSMLTTMIEYIKCPEDRINIKIC